jgi:hypothetical protein
MMRYRLILYVLLLSLPWLEPVPATQEAPDLWQHLAPGISYREFYLPAPNHVYVSRMDRTEPSVTVDSSISQGKLSGELETVRGMAQRYDQAINYWDEEWGKRNQVVVAINGYFFDTKSGIPWSGQLQSGWYVKRFEDRQNHSGFVWTMDRLAFIGGCIVHPPGKQIITHVPTGRTILFDGINVPREENQLIIYTPQYDATTPAEDEGFEALIELERPMMILPSPAMNMGIVRQINDGQGSTPIPFDHIVLSASGKAADALRGSLSIGDQVGISQELRHLDSSCSSPLPQSWTKAYAAVGASYNFLREGVIQGSEDLGALLHNPRTAVAFDDSYIYFIVVDGRQPLHSLGMSMVDLGLFAKLTLGATWGVALDGGGSTTMVVNGEVVNRPNPEIAFQSDNEIMSPSNSRATGGPKALFSHSEQTRNTIERVVANGLMMVIVQPKEQSTRFTPGTKVSITGGDQVAVRLGPGTNYAALAYLTPNTQGTLLDHLLDGVLAKDFYWWKADFGDVSGWVAEEYLLPSIP